MTHPEVRWIWHPHLVGVNQYAEFRRCFIMAGVPEQVDLAISVDSDFQLWVNGREIYARQFSDYPTARTYSLIPGLEKHLQAGENLLAVRVFYRGEDASDHRSGRPGLIAELRSADGETIVPTDRRWQCRPSPSFGSGPLPRVSPQMGFTVECDGRGADGWQDPGFSPGPEWLPAAEQADRRGEVLRPRPLPQLIPAPTLPPVRVIATGPIIRTRLEAPAAEAVATDFIRRAMRSSPATLPLELPPPVKGESGAFVLADLGREEVGLLELEVEAPAGTQVDIGHGEHLEDLGVRCWVGGRHFGDRYFCHDGRNRFTIPFRRLGCRYLQLHFLGYSQPVRLLRVGVRPLSYPIRCLGEFTAPDPVLTGLYETGVRTLQLCMHEHYEDCPWREQSLYAFDSRNQALYGYYAFGEYAFAATSLRLLGNGLRPDGLLELCAPARVPVNIPIFSLVWIVALRDHFLFSGEDTLLREFQPTIETILRTFLAKQDPQTGLYENFDDQWTFYEWAPGLSEREDPGAFRLDAPHNLFLLEALDAYVQMLTFAGGVDESGVWREKATTLRKTIWRRFWDPSHYALATFLNRRERFHHASLTQALALCLGVVPDDQKTLLYERLLTDQGLVPMALSSLLYGTHAFREADRTLREWYRRKLAAGFAEMLFRGATSLWETQAGAADFEGAGSLCHGWSALPVWLAQADMLGIRPLTPGFRRFEVHPSLPAGLTAIAGAVPTPAGLIRVSVERSSGQSLRVQLHAPDALEPVPAAGVDLHCESKIRARPAGDSSTALVSAATE